MGNKRLNLPLPLLLLFVGDSGKKKVKKRQILFPKH